MSKTFRACSTNIPNIFVNIIPTDVLTSKNESLGVRPIFERLLLKLPWKLWVSAQSIRGSDIVHLRVTFSRNTE